jgi:hypothetical protein
MASRHLTGLQVGLGAAMVVISQQMCCSTAVVKAKVTAVPPAPNTIERGSHT